VSVAVHDRYVVADTVSEAWLGACAAVEPLSSLKAVHLVVRITDPTAELAEIRSLADELIEARDQAKGGDHYKPIRTVRNTIFPARWAAKFPEPSELAAHYRERFAAQLREHEENRRGTYFGRMVAFPRGGEEFGDQLSNTVEKLREELQATITLSSRYEINVYSEQRDGRVKRGFPCLSFLSLHLHEGALHMQAHYRNEHLIARGYGNYLGLGELLAYLARACEVDVGELALVAGHAELDAPKTAIRDLLERAGVELEAAVAH
jgi:thymidylate synthase